MEVKLDKQYPLDVDATRAWALLTDLKAVASCMPGAEITEHLSDTSYKGAVKVVRGKGADKGGSSASMDLTAIITPDPANPAHCVLNGQAAVIVNGKFAQFGGRMMVQVSDMLLAQFVENFRQTALTLPTATGAASSPSAAKVSAPVVAREINGLAIFWALVKSWLGGLFSKRG